MKQPEKCLKESTAVTIKDAILSKSPSLFHLGAFDSESPKIILTFLIEDLILFFNVGKTMNASQQIETIRLILSDPLMKSLKPDDFKLCFENAKKGVYGKAYDRIDGQVIFEWLNIYTNERMDVHESLAIQQHQERPALEKQIPVNPEGQKKVVELLKSVIEGTTIETKKIVKREVVKTDRDIFIQSCFMEFTKMKKTAIEGIGLGYVLYKGFTLDETEYVQARVKEYDINNSK